MTIALKHWMDIPGWCPEEEGEFLQQAVRDYAKEKIVVEIGSWCGRSASCMAEAGPKKVYCFDPYPAQSQAVTEAKSNGSGINAPLALEMMLNAVRHSNGIIILYIQSGEMGGLQWVGNKVSLLYVDGEHHSDTIKDELTAWLPHMSKDSAIIFDDYYHKQFGPDIEIAANGVLTDWEIHKVWGSKALWIRK